MNDKDGHIELKQTDGVSTQRSEAETADIVLTDHEEEMVTRPDAGNAPSASELIKSFFYY